MENTRSRLLRLVLVFPDWKKQGSPAALYLNRLAEVLGVLLRVFGVAWLLAMFIDEPMGLVQQRLDCICLVVEQFGASRAIRELAKKLQRLSSSRTNSVGGRAMRCVYRGSELSLLAFAAFLVGA
ncbi:hypothetical protein [Melittangium boletus]|uniref:hypothetical protein n=1 Tax=Melittangium boletus TaxID=83453 RepID=UPI003DA305B0